jgi:hypothetical protein
VQVLITRVSVILLASRVNRCLHQSWQTAKVTLDLRKPSHWRACDHRRCCAGLNQLSRSLSGTLTAPGAVRFNHPHLDLVKSIGVCSASPPTQSGGGAFFGLYIWPDSRVFRIQRQPFLKPRFICDITMVNNSLLRPHAYYFLRRRSTTLSPVRQPQITRSKLKLPFAFGE